MAKFHGILLPIETGEVDRMRANLIVNIIPELNQSFNTKERAPFKIVCECIKYSEVNLPSHQDINLEINQ